MKFADCLSKITLTKEGQKNNLIHNFNRMSESEILAEMGYKIFLVNDGANITAPDGQKFKLSPEKYANWKNDTVRGYCINKAKESKKRREAEAEKKNNTVLNKAKRKTHA